MSVKAGTADAAKSVGRAGANSPRRVPKLDVDGKDSNSNSSKSSSSSSSSKDSKVGGAKQAVLAAARMAGNTKGTPVRFKTGFGNTILDVMTYVDA